MPNFKIAHVAKCQEGGSGVLVYIGIEVARLLLPIIYNSCYITDDKNLRGGWVGGRRVK